MSILSIDVGTTNLKVGLVDETGNVLALEKAKTPVYSDKPSFAEHDPEELFELICALSKKIILDTRAEVSAVALSCYQFGLLFLDKEKKPQTRISLLSDMRARETFGAFKEYYRETDLYHKTGSPEMVQTPLCRLFYFKEFQPEVLKNASYIVSAKDYFIYRLSGELVTEPSVSAVTQYLNVKTCTWDDEILSTLGLTTAVLPPIKDGLSTVLEVGETSAEKLGITKNTPLLLGVYDGATLFAGASGFEEGSGVINLGTSGMLRVPSGTPLFDDEARSIYPYCVNQNLYLNGGAMNNAASTLDWFLSNISELDVHALSLSAEKIKALPVTLPYLTGERNPQIGAYSAGVFYGLRPEHTKHDMALSILEGVSFSLNLIREALLKQGLQIRRFFIAGGGVEIKVWPQIFASLFNTSFSVSKLSDQALVGNAVMALAATGRFSSLAEAFKTLSGVSQEISPDQNLCEALNERYFKFRRILGANVALFNEL